MQRLLSGALCLVALYTLCGCAAWKDDLIRSAHDSAGKTDCKSSVAIPASNETQAQASIAGANEYSSALIPQTVQTCRIDSASCLLQATSPRAAAPDTGAPVVHVPETSYDFGTMQEDKDFLHKFTVMNFGTAELVIKKIIPD
ncbi:MAG TPA: hypothetical protein VEF34_02210 [Syntrophobacteraceae bacterium]|nr:hypothetical protein [Syntrophobacteraceae bacterium]